MKNVSNSLSEEQKLQLRQYVYNIVGCCQEVHRELGCYLNEYMYQDALEIAFHDAKIDCVREFHFTTMFHGQKLHHEHQVDFLVKNHVFVECKAIKELTSENRQQLWNYMRLTDTRIGILLRV